MKKKDKIIFVISFAVFYSLLLILGILVFGNLLLGIEEKIIYLLLGNSVNYNAFDFVVYCSGIVSIAAYLGVIFGFLVVRIKPVLKVVIASIILLWVINLLRIIIVLLSEKIGLERSTHVLSWFLMGAVVVWAIKISNK
jgi:exosortase/archaeosortase family protein